MKKQETTPKTREQLFAEKAGKSYTVCYSQTCTLRQHCLRWQLSSYQQVVFLLLSLLIRAWL